MPASESFALSVVASEIDAHETPKMAVPRRRLSVTLKRDPAIEVSRVSLGGQKLVYILVQDKKHKYKKGRSRVAYIGTTKNGANRVANSSAVRAGDILGSRGVRRFEARIITCRPRQNVKTWVKLERALLLTFREMYGEVPRCNSHGKKIKEFDEYRYFAKSRLKRILEDLA